MFCSGKRKLAQSKSVGDRSLKSFKCILHAGRSLSNVVANRLKHSVISEVLLYGYETCYIMVGSDGLRRKLLLIWQLLFPLTLQCQIGLCKLNITITLDFRRPNVLQSTRIMLDLCLSIAAYLQKQTALLSPQILKTTMPQSIRSLSRDVSVLLEVLWFQSGHAPEHIFIYEFIWSDTPNIMDGRNIISSLALLALCCFGVDSVGVDMGTCGCVCGDGGSDTAVVTRDGAVSVSAICLYSFCIRGRYY